MAAPVRTTNSIAAAGRPALAHQSRIPAGFRLLDVINSLGPHHAAAAWSSVDNRGGGCMNTNKIIWFALGKNTSAARLRSNGKACLIANTNRYSSAR